MTTSKNIEWKKAEIFFIFYSMRPIAITINLSVYIIDYRLLMNLTPISFLYNIACLFYVVEMSMFR